MPYIYQADIYCDPCGDAICDELTIEGHEPDDLDDESTFDSSEYPKQVRDDEKSDLPRECSNRNRCQEAITLPSGLKIGKPIGELTPDGVEYLRRAIAEGGEVAEFWAEHYAACLQ